MNPTQTNIVLQFGGEVTHFPSLARAIEMNAIFPSNESVSLARPPSLDSSIQENQQHAPWLHELKPNEQGDKRYVVYLLIGLVGFMTRLYHAHTLVGKEFGTSTEV